MITVGFSPSLRTSAGLADRQLKPRVLTFGGYWGGVSERRTWMDHAAHQRHHEPAPTAAAHHEGHAAGHDRHAGHSVAMFRDKFWLSLALTIPTVLLSPEVAGWIGYTIPAIPGIEYVPAILGTIIFLYGGLVFIRGAQGELADRQPGMMTLISLAIIVAFVTSWAGTLGFFEVEIWWELATLITIMLLGHWLEMRSIAQAQGALSALAALLPDTAERVAADGTEEVPISALQVDDVVLVRPGARVPADGLIVDGTADVDESMITGESRAISKQVGDEVIAGTVAAGGSLRVKVTATGDQTALSGIMRLVAQAQASASRAQALADRAAALLFYVALAAGAITLVGWWLLGDPEGALVRTVTVLVIACPHALGLAIPLVIAISTSLGAQNGLLIKDRLALERARTLDTVIFDKTGTLTKGEPVLVDVAAGSMDTDRVLGLAASVEADSEHPLARAIVEGAKQRGVETRPASDFEAMAGRGAHARVHGHDVFVGGPRLLQEMDSRRIPRPRTGISRADRPPRRRRWRRGRHRGRRGQDPTRVQGSRRRPPWARIACRRQTLPQARRPAVQTSLPRLATALCLSGIRSGAGMDARQGRYLGQDSGA